MGRIVKKLCLWLSGFLGGVFLGALIACPAKEISLPTSATLAIIFGIPGSRW